MRSFPTVAAATVLACFGVVALSHKPFSAPIEVVQSSDGQFIQQLDDQEATLNQRRQAKELLRAFVRGQLASFYWGQFASSLRDLGLSSDESLNVHLETNVSSTRLWLTPKRGDESYLAVVYFNGEKLVRLQCRGLATLPKEQTFSVCPEGWTSWNISEN